METGKQVLVIDDDAMIRGLVSAMLESEGFLVGLAEDGEKGIALLEGLSSVEDLSLVILDVVMPGLNGLEVLTKVRANPKIANIPVLMLTGESKAEDILAGYNVGADYYITKPFTRQQLMYGVEMLLAAKK